MGVFLLLKKLDKNNVLCYNISNKEVNETARSDNKVAREKENGKENCREKVDKEDGKNY